jgi:putative tryptophan/tyrosine transport system substrate-binding protein
MSSRREFITLVGIAAGWPLAARAQQGERMRRIGVLAAGNAANDPDLQTRMAAFAQGLQQLGWTDGRNVQVEYRWSEIQTEQRHRYVIEAPAQLTREQWIAKYSPTPEAIPALPPTITQ